MVTKHCPQTLKHHFPTKFPDAIAPAHPTSAHAVAIDRAPVANACFVYPRQRGMQPVCRLEMKYPRQKEVFYLRHMLLNFSKQSFADCKVHNGRQYKSHEEAMHATGFFARNDEAELVLNEMIELHYTGSQLRFAFLVLLEQEAAPINLYKKYEHVLMKDFLDKGRSPATARKMLQMKLKASWLANGNAESSWELDLDNIPGHNASDEICTTMSQKPRDIHEMIAQDTNQNEAATYILSCVRQCKNTFVFVEGKAGTGKSTLAKYTTAVVEGHDQRVINVGTTGQAALQLPHGATAHSQFGIPLEDDGELTCTLGLRCQTAKDIAECVLIQWDEWPSAKRSAWEAVLRLLESLAAHYPDTYKPKTIVCYGDFRQIPPVLPNGSRDAIVAQSVQSTPSWQKFTHLHLPTVHRQSDDAKYGKWLEAIGDGNAPRDAVHEGEKGFTELPMCEVLHSEEEALKWCFPHLNDAQACAHRKIVATTNTMVDAFNHRALEILVRTYGCESTTACSADSIDMDAACEDLMCSVDFLNAQHYPGSPPHSLRLVLGALYELMRNFSPEHRLMNHTPVILKEIHAHHVVVTTLDNRDFPLPRICFRWPLAKGTTTMTRKQYPLRSAYACTYNGCQACTLQSCVVDIRKHPFTHGHLYVALSRVRRRADIRILALPEQLNNRGNALTKNIVWPELLLGRKVTKSNLKRPASVVFKRPGAATKTPCVRAHK